MSNKEELSCILKEFHTAEFAEADILRNLPLLTSVISNKSGVILISGHDSVIVRLAIAYIVRRVVIDEITTNRMIEIHTEEMNEGEY